MANVSPHVHRVVLCEVLDGRIQGSAIAAPFRFASQEECFYLLVCVHRLTLQVFVRFDEEIMPLVRMEVKCLSEKIIFTDERLCSTVCCGVDILDLLLTPD